MQFTFTLGPASIDDPVLSEFMRVADRFRLNASHLTPRKLAQWLKKLDEAFSATGRRLPVVVDLRGAKVRIGEYPDLSTIPQRVRLALRKASTDPELIPVPHEIFFENAKSGDVVSLNDGRVVLKILGNPSKSTAESSPELEATVLENGPLSSRKGLNRVAQPLHYGSLSMFDAESIRASMKYDFVEYAFSFVYDGSEAEVLRPLTGSKKLVAKIERVEAFEHLAAIDRQFDELWLCRGDLGAQAGVEQLGPLQARFVREIPKLTRPTGLAGQVLEYMTHFPHPTRSEVVHLHDARAAGFNSIVLSDETAVGRNPAAVARFIRLIK